MLQATSFGSQPQTQEKKKSIVLPVLVGAVAGGGVSAATKLGKVDKYEDADTFVKSEEATKELEEVKDKAEDVKTLKSAIDDQGKTKKANEETIKALFPDENTKEVPVAKVLEKTEGKPTFAALQATVTDEGAKALTAQEEELKKITEEAGKLENGKDVTIGEKEAAIKIAKDKDGKVSITKGAGKKAETKTLEDATAAVEKNKKLKALAEKLGIKADTKVADLKVNKETASSVLETAAKSVGENVKTAFNNIKELLPKKFSGLKIGGWAAGGALVAGALAALVGGNKE